MSRKKTGAVRATTLADTVSAQIGERVISTRSAARALGVSEELLVGLVRRKGVRAVKHVEQGDRVFWFIPESELDRVVALVE
jgi:hypothetical protein